MCAYGTLRIKNCHCEERNDVAISRKGHDIKIRFASAGFSRCCNATPQNDIKCAARIKPNKKAPVWVLKLNSLKKSEF